MKPADKYRQKFVELLKEAEEELGEYLLVRVGSYRKPINNNANSYPYTEKVEKEYRFQIQTNGDCVY